MKLPNGYGSVYKLSGKRRKPWAARKTIGWKTDTETMKAQPTYKFIGYYATKTEAMQALAEYNNEPVHFKDITLGDLYDKWSAINYPKMNKGTVKTLKSGWNVLKEIENTNLKDIKLNLLQSVIDRSDKRRPTLKFVKTLLGHLFDYAILNEMCDASKRTIVQHIDLSKADNDRKIFRTPFTDDEIKSLWDVGDATASIVLILIYTGLRVNELFDLKTADVNLDERYFYVKSSKTESGIRQVPIAEKIVPLIKTWLDNDTLYLVTTATGKHILYENFRLYWDPLMCRIGAEHLPHDTRHTCITLLTNKGVDGRLIKSIVGHKGNDVTDVYTHYNLKQKLDAINSI